jgi:hypothetical protein
MLLTRIVYATVTGRIDCDENPDHEYCKGDKGKNGVPFCDLDYQELGFTVCRDRDVNPDVDCDVKSDDSLCNSERGRDGLIFCDLLYQKTGSKDSSCSDRNDNPQEYYAKYGESDKDFCEIMEC